MKVRLNFEQRKSLSDFFKSLAVAWFAAAFTVPVVDQQYAPLIIIRFLSNMFIALFVSLYLLKEDT